MLPRFVVATCVAFAAISRLHAAESPRPADPAPATLRIATFDVDATPPIGSMMAYDPVTNRWDLGLRARGIVLLGAGEPIVLCAVDWIGIANEGPDAFQEALARAGGTSPRRVAVHALHQHDAPDCDFPAERILKEAGPGPRQFDGRFQRQVISDLEAAVRECLPRAQPGTHLGLGEARVEKVASNRRILGPDGRVRATRWTATVDAGVRAEPAGVIDPMVSLVSFWNEDRPVAVLSYYATHPRSYYRTGIPNPELRVSSGSWLSRQRCTFISTAPVAISAPANTTTALWRTALHSPNASPTECAAPGKAQSAVPSPLLM